MQYIIRPIFTPDRVQHGMLLEDIRDTRRSQGLSQGDLAKRVDTNLKAIQRLERGIGSVALLVRVMDGLAYRVAGLASGRSFPEQLRNRRRNLGWSAQEAGKRADIALLRGGLRFIGPEGKALPPAPFSMMLVVIGAKTGQIERFASLVECRVLPRSECPD